MNDVLYDYTPGMCVIVAESLSQCKTLFMKEFGDDGVNHPAGVVDYVYGGG